MQDLRKRRKQSTLWRRPGTTTVAAGLSKNFVFTERLRPRFEGTFSNLLHHKAFRPQRTAETELANFPCGLISRSSAPIALGPAFER
jgi:hypothetical protein